MEKMEPKKLLILDRDGTIIVEPSETEQVDTLEQMTFLPGVISALRMLRGLDYEWVMATNQDGLGGPGYPEAHFAAVQGKMLEILRGEGIVFDDILIDRHFKSDNAPTRKPGTGMFGKYIGRGYDLTASCVIGDRITDVELAKNLGAKAIFIQPKERGRAAVEKAGLGDICTLVSDDWGEIAEFLRRGERTAMIRRKTGETDIAVTLDLDGGSQSHVATGIGFFDHMLMQLPHHAGVSLVIEATGDLHVDEHHTVEDTGITLGEAFRKALGDKRGIERYGYVLPMDESRAMVLLDFGGRAAFEWEVDFRREKIGEMPTELFKHFFKSFSDEARCNLHIAAKGENEHHKIEGVFKAFARAIKMAIAKNPFSYDLPSSKGVL